MLWQQWFLLIGAFLTIPWVLFFSDSGIEFFDRYTPSRVLYGIVMGIVDILVIYSIDNFNWAALALYVWTIFGICLVCAKLDEYVDTIDDGGEFLAFVLIIAGYAGCVLALA